MDSAEVRCKLEAAKRHKASSCGHEVSQFDTETQHMRCTNCDKKVDKHNKAI